MNRIIWLLALTFSLQTIVSATWSQDNNSNPQISPDVRLAEAFGTEFTDRLMHEKPNLVIYYNLFLDSSYYITELPVDKSDFLESIKVLPIDPTTDPKDINVLKYELKLKFDTEMYFRMSESNKVMVFYSGEELTKKYNDRRRALGLITESRNQ